MLDVLDMSRTVGGKRRNVGICTVGRKSSGHSVRGEAGSVPAFRLQEISNALEVNSKHHED